MAFTFDQIFAADPANPANIAQNASIKIFAPGDATKAAIAITDTSGTPLPNPIPVNANGFGPAFAHATLDRVAWEGGGFTGFFTSYEGMKQVALDAQAAAENAATIAGTEAAAVADAAVASVIADADASAAAAASSATAAANAAALVGAPADTAIAAAVNNGASATKAALNATYAQQFTATGTTTVAQVNAWLATPYDGPKRLTGVLTLNAPLLIKSGTHLDASGATITSTHVGHMIHNENYASTTVRDSNIVITGGTWQRNAGGPASGSGNGWANAAHSIFLRHVDKLTIRNLRVGSSGGKYMIAIGDVTDFYVADIHAESVASDTVHMTGPCSQGVVERIRVASGGDDCVAFTTTDYISYDDVHGSFANITVRDVTANNATRTVLIGGSGSGADDGFNLSRITVDGVLQKGTGGGVSIGAPFNTNPLNDLVMRNIQGSILVQYKRIGTVVAENTGRIVVGPEAGQSDLTVQRLVIREPRPASGEFLSITNVNVTVDTIEASGVVSTNPIAMTLDKCTVKTVTVRGMNHTGSQNPFELSAIITNFNLDGFVGTIQPAYCVANVTLAGTIGTMNVTNAAYTAADTNSGILARVINGNIGTLNVNGGLFTGIGRLLDIASGIAGSTNLNLVNLTFTGCNRIVQSGGSGSVNVAYSNVAFNSGLNQPFRVFGAASLNVRGGGWTGYPNSAIPAPGTGIIKVNAQDMPVDLSILGKTNGDRANNTNAGLACGVGPAISNGTNWKNIYSGATY
jgi:hypothetical protein